MKNLPTLNLSSRKLVTRGADFRVFRLEVKAPALQPRLADRLETWKQLTRKELAWRRKVENYYMDTDCKGRVFMVPTWEDNWRLAMIEGRPFELLSSKAVSNWR